MKTLAVFVCIVFAATCVQYAQGFGEKDLHSHLSSDDGEDEQDGGDSGKHSHEHKTKGWGRKKHSKYDDSDHYGYGGPYGPYSSYGYSYGPSYGYGGYAKLGGYGYGGYGLHGYGGYGYGSHGRYGGHGHGKYGGYGGYGYGGYGHHGKLHGKHHSGYYKHYQSPYARKTKYAIDNYLAKTHLLGDRRLQVNFKYLNTPLEVQYLNQYHAVQHPLSNTRIAPLFGLPYAPKYPSPYGHLWGGQPATHMTHQQQQPASYSTPQAAYQAQPQPQAFPAQPQPTQPAQRDDQHFEPPPADYLSEAQYQPAPQQTYEVPIYQQPQQYSQPQPYQQAS